MHFKEILRHNEYLKITLEDNHGNEVDVIYDDPDKVCPLEYFVWSFRHNTECGSIHLPRPEIDKTNKKIDEKSAYFCKMRNSNYIKQFDSNPIANRELFPEVEHHLYITGDEIFEVISNYEPRFVAREK
ncbi:hypothetical protein SAMN05216389_10735 [Oceanobacillus limi]|uniref:Uncharacterized protein n=2 Tax=Oceanobacillus limi TaxID=930131 RepID=A0A1I0CS75_9BACI|nr:hypothetical protein SAMN05216389_10735 [Oceanobacillus limi]